MSVSRSVPTLVVDDVPLMVAVVRRTLERLGFAEVDEAADGETALARMRTRRYGLVIADCNMSPMNGLDLLRCLRADPALRETPFVLMTTKEHADRLVRARQAGANACLLKPFTPVALKEAIDAACTNDSAGPTAGRAMGVSR